jgi:hypothetical protein
MFGHPIEIENRPKIKPNERNDNKSAIKTTYNAKNEQGDKDSNINDYRPQFKEIITKIVENKSFETTNDKFQGHIMELKDLIDNAAFISLYPEETEFVPILNIVCKNRKTIPQKSLKVSLTTNNQVEFTRKYEKRGAKRKKESETHDYICRKCYRIDPVLESDANVKENVTTNWICCEICTCWFHKGCLSSQIKDILNTCNDHVDSI